MRGPRVAGRLSEAFAQALASWGARRVYGIIGTTVLDLFDALYSVRDRVEVVTTRHEQVAVSAADAEGRVTGRPGVAVVHAAPGLLNAMVSLGIAYRDRAPLVVIAGGVRRRLRGTDAWLEVDLETATRPIAKYYRVAGSPREALEALREAFEAAASPPRGPAIVEVPEDLWKARAPGAPEPPEAREPEAGGAGEMASRVAELAREAGKPLILACGELAMHPGFRQDLLLALAERMDAYIVTSGNGRGACPEDHPRCLGRTGFGGGSTAADTALAESDLVVVLGNEFDDITTYAYNIIPEGDVVVASLDPSTRRRPRYYEHYHADPNKSLQALLQAVPKLERPGWRERIRELRASWAKIVEEHTRPGREGVSPGQFFQALDKALGRDRIVSAGQGTHILYTYSFMRIYRPRSFLAATNLGAMSYALPAGLGAKLSSPGRQVVTVAGDGDFLMTVQDLETLARKRVPLGMVVVNDGSYRVLYLKQLIQYQGRVYETLLGNPDFSLLARSFNIPHIRVDDKEKVGRAVEALARQDESVIVELPVDPGEVPPLNLEATLAMGR
ncbi:MAG: thiamine pyrophosphate-binding protein [Desulfurococcales archaeon]|nr:thiamine pyrophosphate-binding protein [Desulfurococcales archaeon]